MAGLSRERQYVRSVHVGIAFGSCTLTAATFAVLEKYRVAQVETRVLHEIGARRTATLADLFARAVWNDWRNLEILAQAAPALGPAERRAILDQIVSKGERISWAGIADRRGEIEVASEGALEGASAAERPWFREGLAGTFAGDVHEAKLLAELLPQSALSPIQFFDLALPVQDGTGAASGVAAFHVSVSWAQAYLSETSAFLGLDAVIINGAGKVVIGPEAFVGENFEPGSRSASAGAAGGGAGAGKLVWPDGEKRASIVVAMPEYRNLPRFDWRFVTRLDPKSALQVPEWAWSDYLIALAVASLVSGLLSLVMIDRSRRTAALRSGDAPGPPRREL